MAVAGLNMILIYRPYIVFSLRLETMETPLDKNGRQHDKESYTTSTTNIGTRSFDLQLYPQETLS